MFSLKTGGNFGDLHPHIWARAHTHTPATKHAQVSVTPESPELSDLTQSTKKAGFRGFKSLIKYSILKSRKLRFKLIHTVNGPQDHPRMRSQCFTYSVNFRNLIFSPGNRGSREDGKGKTVFLSFAFFLGRTPRRP